MTDFSPGTKQLMQRFVDRDHQYISEAGRTKLLLHEGVTPKAVVLFHGLTASPTQFERFARELYDKGYNVFVPRLPRHGHADRLSPALLKLNAGELRDFTTDSVHLAQGLGEKVIIAGFSLGGLLTAWAAQQFPVERAVAIAPFLSIALTPNRFTAPLTALLNKIPNIFAWWDPIAKEKLMPAHGYPRYGTRALGESLVLAREVIANADRLLAAKKLILVTNSREIAVSNRAVTQVEQRLRRFAAAQLDRVWLRDLPISHDIIEPLRHPEAAERVFPAIMKLIEGEE